MGPFRKLAVKRYSKELSETIEALSALEPGALAYALARAVWLRARLEANGDLPAFAGRGEAGGGQGCCDADELKKAEKLLWFFDRRKHRDKALAMSIWVHTLRSELRPELAELAERMWALLMASAADWEESLARLRDEDLGRGIPLDTVEKTEAHAREIVSSLPPGRPAGEERC
jgi:hypothetical protein